MEHLEVFRRDLLSWFARFQRDLPWRQTRDAYAIWLSEIMLQQTRVAAVIPYYARFLTRFPNVEALANAPEEELLTQWAGLGYYYRARNLQKAAKAIAEAGQFPSSHEAIGALPGVGAYTAAAVASIAFGLPFAALDGNVFRVLSRLYGDETDIGSSAGKKEFAALANQTLDRQNPGAFNQAMMELGATVCLPKAPQCLLCPVAGHCKARAENRTAELPVKVVGKKSVKRDRLLYWIERNGEVLLWQRTSDSRLMAGFWELPEPEQLPGLAAGELLGTFKHNITIYDYRFRIVSGIAPLDLGVCQWKPMEQLAGAPVSTIFRKAKRVLESRIEPLAAKGMVSR